MNLKSEAARRTMVVTLGTAAAVALVSATATILPFDRSDRTVVQLQSIETGFVDQPQHPSSGSRRSAQVPPPAKRQPPPPPAPAPPEPAPIPMPKPLEAPPLAHDLEPPKAIPSPAKPPPPPETVKPVPPTPPPTDAAAKDEPSDPSAQSEGPGRSAGAAGAIFKPTPIIPPELRRHVLNAIAVVRFNIGTDGRPAVVLEKATSDPEINQILLDTFGRWRFFPAMQGGKPVASTLVLRVPVKVE